MPGSEALNPVEAYPSACTRAGQLHAPPPRTWDVPPLHDHDKAAGGDFSLVLPPEHFEDLLREETLQVHHGVGGAYGQDHGQQQARRAVQPVLLAPAGGHVVDVHDLVLEQAHRVMVLVDAGAVGVLKGTDEEVDVQQALVRSAKVVHKANIEPQELAQGKSLHRTQGRPHHVPAGAE